MRGERKQHDRGHRALPEIDCQRRDIEAHLAEQQKLRRRQDRCSERGGDADGVITSRNIAGTQGNEGEPDETKHESSDDSGWLPFASENPREQRIPQRPRERDDDGDADIGSEQGEQKERRRQTEYDPEHDQHTCLEPWMKPTELGSGRHQQPYRQHGKEQPPPGDRDSGEFEFTDEDTNRAPRRHKGSR